MKSRTLIHFLTFRLINKETCECECSRKRIFQEIYVLSLARQMRILVTNREQWPSGSGAGFPIQGSQVQEYQVNQMSTKKLLGT